MQSVIIDDDVVRDHLEGDDTISTAPAPQQAECNQFAADAPSGRSDRRHDVTGAFSVAVAPCGPVCLFS